MTAISWTQRKPKRLAFFPLKSAKPWGLMKGALDMYYATRSEGKRVKHSRRCVYERRACCRVCERDVRAASSYKSRQFFCFGSLPSGLLLDAREKETNGTKGKRARVEREQPVSRKGKRARVEGEQPVSRKRET